MKMKENRKSQILAASFILAFVLWTVAVRFINVQAIGPEGSRVGFAVLNEYFHDLTGVNMTLYMVTDWLGLVPIGVAASFGMLGLVEWIKRRRITAVDGSLLALGGFYVAVIAVYIFFENVVINYRPILIDGCLEASYPSSTTMLAMCVMPAAMIELNSRIKNKAVRAGVQWLIAAFTAFMVVGRLLSGVHWISDIIGGALISTGLVSGYYSVAKHR
jgi:undecaprenyl-diphosphatase